MHHLHDEEIKTGDTLMFTEEVEFHLQDLGIEHDLRYGDELVVVAREDKRKFPVCITNPRDTAWQAWIFLTIAEQARGDWLISKGVEPARKPLEHYIEEFSRLPRQERIRKWEELREATFQEAVEAWKKYHPGQDFPL